MPAEDVEVDVTYTANQYTITYKDSATASYTGSNGAMLPTTHTYGTETELIDGIKIGYIFGGWYENDSYTGTPLTVLGATDYTSNITLYAKWIANLTPYLSRNWATIFTTGLNTNRNKIGTISFTKNLPSGNYVNVSSTINGEDFIGIVKAYYILNEITDLYDISIYANAETINFPTLSTGMFSNLSSLTSIDFGTDCINTSNVTSMESMFNKCLSLVNLNLAKFNMENTIDVTNMFKNTTNLRTIVTPASLNINVNSINLANNNYYVLDNPADGNFKEINSSNLNKTLKLGYTLNYVLNNESYLNEIYFVDYVNTLPEVNLQGYNFYGWHETNITGDLTNFVNNSTFDGTGKTGTVTLYGKTVKKGARNVTGYSDDTIRFNVSAPSESGVYGYIKVEYYDEDLDVTKVNTYLLTGAGLTLTGLRYGTYNITISTLITADSDSSTITLNAGYKVNNEVNIIITDKTIEQLHKVIVI